MTSAGRGASDGEGALVCPSCGRRHPADERFCAGCGMPLVAAPAPDGAPCEPPTEQQQRIRKIKPQLAEGALVRVAGGRNLAEAEFIQGLLLEEGVPSLLRRTAGFDVPDFLAAGPRDVLVPQTGVSTAREVLLEADLIGPERPASTVDPRRLLLGLVTALVIGALIIWAIGALIH
jgi:hypothetical protein